MNHLNSMYVVKTQDIQEIEKYLGKNFPNSLKRVWETYGSGFIKKSHDGKKITSNVNRLCGPNAILELLKGEYPSDGVDFGMGIPFFEIYMGRFLMIGSECNSDAVTDEFKNVISDTLDNFIKNLLEDPECYDKFL